MPDILELVADFVKVLVHLVEAVPEAILDLIKVRLEGVGHRGELPAYLVQMGCQRGVKRGFKAGLQIVNDVFDELLVLRVVCQALVLDFHDSINYELHLHLVCLLLALHN